METRYKNSVIQKMFDEIEKAKKNGLFIEKFILTKEETRQLEREKPTMGDGVLIGGAEIVRFDADKEAVVEFGGQKEEGE